MSIIERSLSHHGSKRRRPPHRPYTHAPGNDFSAITQAVLAQLQTDAQPLYNSLGVEGALAVDNAAIGDFPWFWNEAGTFNAYTWNWLNNRFAYNPAAGYLAPAGDALVTDLTNVYNAMAYELDAADTQTLNEANLQAATQLNAVVSIYNAQGFSPPIPSTAITPSAKITFIATTIAGWANPPITLQQLANAPDPMALLPNAPPDGGQLVAAYVLYLGKVGIAVSIMNAQALGGSELRGVQKNLENPPQTVTAGYMATIDDGGTQSIVPAIGIVPDTGTIQSSLQGGSTVSLSFSVQKVDQNTVQVSTSTSGGVQGGGDFFGFGAGTSSQYNLFNFGNTETSCMMTFTYNGVTLVTPQPYQYEVGPSTGWWLPGAVHQAVENPSSSGNPSQSGFTFSSSPPYKFGNPGDFGVLDNIVISQLPEIQISYQTTNTQIYQETFATQTQWSVEFLGIDLASGSSSSYQSSYDYDQSTQTVTITMSPPALGASTSPLDQDAYVIGASVLWLGAQG